MPFIEWDLGGCKGEGLVGQAENAMRDATKRIHGLSESGSDILFIATCNSIASVPPELRRRFKLSTLFVDLPDDQENAALWKLKMKQIGVSGKTPPSKDWTGAEIETCCELARDFGCSLVEAAGWIVPIAQSAADKVADLRSQAAGRFKSASYAGMYQMPGKSAKDSGKRSISNSI